MKASLRNIKTVLVPIGAGTDGQTALAIAQTIAGKSFWLALYRSHSTNPSAQGRSWRDKSASVCFP